MVWRRFQIEVPDQGRGTYDITAEINSRLAESEVRVGLAHLFIHHTSASLLLCENADPSVRRDLETFMHDLVRDGDPRFVHNDEGPDDMAAHVRSVLTQSGLSIPVVDGRLDLGTWQGIYLWEHRRHPHTRTITLTVHGETA